MKKRIYYRIFCAIAVFMVLKSGRMIYHKKVDNINITKEGPAREQAECCQNKSLYRGAEYCTGSFEAF